MVEEGSPVSQKYNGWPKRATSLVARVFQPSCSHGCCPRCGTNVCFTCPLQASVARVRALHASFLSTRPIYFQFYRLKFIDAGIIFEMLTVRTIARLSRTLSVSRVGCTCPLHASVTTRVRFTSSFFGVNSSVLFAWLPPAYASRVCITRPLRASVTRIRFTGPYTFVHFEACILHVGVQHRSGARPFYWPVYLCEFEACISHVDVQHREHVSLGRVCVTPTIYSWVARFRHTHPLKYTSLLSFLVGSVNCKRPVHMTVDRVCCTPCLIHVSVTPIRHTRPLSFVRPIVHD